MYPPDDPTRPCRPKAGQGLVMMMMMMMMLLMIMLKRIRMKMTMTNVSKIDNWKGASHKKQIVDDQIRR